MLTVYQPEYIDYLPLFQTYVDSRDIPVEIRVESVPWVELAQKIPLSFASADAPDLYIIPNFMISEFIRYLTAFADLAKLDAKATAAMKSATAKGVWGTVNPKTRPQTYFVPLQSSPTVLYYRTDLFMKAGLPVAPDQVAAKLNSWSAVSSVGAAFKKKTGTALFGQPVDIFSSMLQLKNPIYYDSKGKYIGDTNAQIKKAYDFSVKGMKDGWIAKVGEKSDALEKAVKSGSVGALYGGSGFGSSLRNWLPKQKGKWGVAAFPGANYDPGLFSAALPESRDAHPETLKLLQWLASADAQLLFAQNYDMLPANIHALKTMGDADSADPYFSKHKIVKTLAQAALKASSDPLSQSLSLGPHNEYAGALEQWIANPKSDPAKLWSAAVKAARKASTAG